jgi:Chaperone of endosialidase
MNTHRKHGRDGVRRGLRSMAGIATLGVVVVAGTAVAAQLAWGGSAPGGEAKAHVAKKKKKKKSRPGPRGPQGPPGPAGPPLTLSGGPCANGLAVTNISPTGALTCAPGVYSDTGQNVGIGPNPFGSITTGEDNLAFGRDALTNVTTGGSNSAVGLFALSSNTVGGANAALGVSTLSANTTGNSNVAIGQGALDSNTTGNSNVAIGISSMLFNTTGSSNTALGPFAGQDLTTGMNNIAIDNLGNAAESNTIRIGDSQTRAFISGISGVTTGGAAVPVLIDAAGQLGTTSSSRRYKTEIRSLARPGRSLMKLRPVSFRYREGPPELHYGLIAEQVAKVLPELVVRGEGGLPETVQYQELPVLLLGAVQDQARALRVERRENEVLEAQNRRQQRQIDWLMRRVRGG